MFAPRFYTTIWPIDAARACPFACSSLRFRRFCSGSLALASLNLTCRNLVPTFPQRSPPLLLTTAACGGLRSVPDTEPEGPSFISRTVTQRRLDRRYSCHNARTGLYAVQQTKAKLDAASAKLDAISQRLPAEFKTIGAEIAAQTSAIAKSIASLRGLAPSPPTSLLPEPATGPKPAPPPKARP